MKKQVAVLTCALLTALHASGQAPGVYWVGDLPGSNFLSVIEGVSNQGIAVGSSRTTAGFESVLWSHSGGLVSIGDLNGGDVDSFAIRITPDAQYVTGIGSTTNSNRIAYRWSEATGMQALGDIPGGTGAQYPWGMSADGRTIVGLSETASGSEVFRWREGEGVASLGTLGHSQTPTINNMSDDASTIVGEFRIGQSAREAFRWTESGGFEPLGFLGSGGLESIAYDASSDGNVIVGYSTDGANRNAFRWTSDGGMEEIPAMGGATLTDARAVSADGKTVVGRVRIGNQDMGMVWTEDGGMRTLLDILMNDYGTDLGGGTITSISAISPDGTIVAGQGIGPTGNTEGFVAFIPAPMSLGTFAPLALMWSRRCRRH